MVRRLAAVWLATIVALPAIWYGPALGAVGRGYAPSVFEPRARREAREAERVARIAARTRENRVVLPSGEVAYATVYVDRGRPRTPDPSPKNSVWMLAMSIILLWAVSTTRKLLRYRTLID